MATFIKRTTALAAWLILISAAFGQDSQQPPAENQQQAPAARVPILRLDADGPVSEIRALAFSGDGKTLYAAGLDKMVYAWTLNAEGRFEYAPAKALRIPIGPDISGTINAMAVSDDGRYLAVGGQAVGRRFTGFREGGLIFPASTKSEQDLLDTGTIYVFDLENPAEPKLTHLRGHLGTVIMLAFAPSKAGLSPILVSGAEEFDKTTGKQVGAVRVWDLDKPQKSIAAKLDLQAPSELKDAAGKPVNLPRAIAALRTGNRPTDVQVGMAWGDNVLRIWNLAKDETALVGNIQSLACGAAAGGQFLVGGFDGRTRQGQLQLWRGTSKGTTAGTGTTAPIGLAKASKANTALVISLKLGQPRTIGFFLADAQTLNRRPGPEVNFGGEVGGNLMRPAYAISPRADFVAVAGNTDRKIHIFRTGPNQPPAKVQELEGVGEIYRQVRFFRKGDALGLGLNEDTGNQQAAADLIFDLSASEVAANRAGWNAAPANAGISARLGAQNGRTTITVDLGQNRTKTIVLPENQNIKEIALCPRNDNHPPLVGVVVTSPLFAESILRIYNAETGERLRQFSGHTDLITSLAFSDDGKLLASAALDRTIRVWGLDDLKEHVGQHGFLEYLSLYDKNDKPTVKEIDPFAAEDVKSALDVNDVIEGFTRPDGTFQPTKKSSSFFYYLSTVPSISEANGRPNAVKLRVRRDGNLLANPPEVEVQQGVDERKPLFTLYFTEGQAGQKSWIGWTPLGPFESSDREVEQLVGWHFNPPRPANPQDFADAPSTYAPLAEYRNDHYTEGLFKSLIAPQEEKKDAAVPPPPPEPPKVSLWIHQLPGPGQAGPSALLDADDQQRIWVERPEFKAQFIVSGVASSIVEETLTWTVDGKEQQFLMVEARPGEFEADLSTFDWKPKDNNESYILRASFTTDADSPEYFAEQAIVFSPPPPPPPPRPKKLPVAGIVSPDILTVLYEPRSPQEIAVEVALRAEDDSPIQPGRATFEINGKPVEKDGRVLAVEFDENLAPIKTTLPLTNGENRIRVRLKASEGDGERLSKSVVVHYRRPPKVIAVQVKADEKEPRAQVTCELQTPADLPPVDFQIYVNDRQFSVDPEQITKAQSETDKTQWTVTAKGVPLLEGENSILFYPRNADSQALTTDRIEVTWNRPPQPPVTRPSRPKIYFTNASDQMPLAGHWQGDNFNAAFNVVTSARLKKVLVYYNGKRLDAPPIPEPDDGSKYEFQVPVQLVQKENPLRVIALDENSLWNEAEVPLVPLKPPVRVVIDKLLVPAENDLVLTPKESIGPEVIFDRPIPDGYVVLIGRIVTSDTSTTFERPWLKVWVNGFLNWARAVPNPNSPTEWNFAVQLNFNKGTGNRLHIELPEAPKSPGSKTQSTVNCENPKTKQNLRVVVIGIDPSTLRSLDTGRMEKELQKAFGVGPEKDSGFAKVRFYPLSTSVRAAEIMAVLDRIHSECQPQAERGGHDVVVVYYQGAEALNRKNEIVLKTQDQVRDPAALTKEELRERLSTMFGAHLVFLDVTDPQETGKDWESDPFLGVLRRSHEGPIAPDHFPLASALQKALPQARELRDLPEALRKILDEQQVDARVPEDLENLIVR